MSALAEKREQVVAEIATLEAALKQIESSSLTELQTIAADEVTCTITSSAAAGKRETIEADLTRKRERINVLNAALPALDARLAEDEASEREKALARAARVFREALKARHAAEKSLSRELRQARNSASELLRHRGFVASALAEARELNSDFQLESNFDEVWDVPNELRDFLVAGPERPVALQADQLAQARRQIARQQGEQLDWLRRSPSRLNLRTLPACLQERGERIVAEAEAAEKAREERKRREAGRALSRMG